MAQTLAYPVINGVRYDHSSLDIKLAGVSYIGVKAINWSDSLEMGKGWGTAAQKLFETRGQYDAEADIELYRAEADAFIQALVQANPNIGLYEIRWDLDITHVSEGGLPPVTDHVHQCRIKKPSNSSTAGNDPLTVKFDLSPMYVLRGGIAPITGLRK